MHPELQPKKVSEFFNAATEIETAGKRFYDAVGGDDANKGDTFTEVEQSGMPVRIPISAYCLRLAYYLWNNIREDQLRREGIIVDDGSDQEFNPGGHQHHPGCPNHPTNRPQPRRPAQPDPNPVTSRGQITRDPNSGRPMIEFTGYLDEIPQPIFDALVEIGAVPSNIVQRQSPPDAEAQTQQQLTEATTLLVDTFGAANVTKALSAVKKAAKSRTAPRKEKKP